MKHCKNCKSEIPSDDVFCPECGTPVASPDQDGEATHQKAGEKFCTHCGVSLVSDDAFCPGCGQPIDGPEIAATSVNAKGSLRTASEANSAPKKIKVFHCPECYMPLVPGSTSCLKCGKRFAQPVPKVAVSSQPQTKVQGTFQDPVLEGTEYHCPKCHVVLETSAMQCSGCGVPFPYPVPAYKMSLREAEQLKREEEQLKRQELEARQAAERERKAQEAWQKADALEQLRAEAKAKAEVVAAQAAEAKRISRDASRERSKARQEAQENIGQVANRDINSTNGAPPLKTSAKKPITAFERTFLSFIGLVVLVAVGVGIGALNDASHSRTYTAPSTSNSSYTSPPPVASPPYQPPLSPSTQPAGLPPLGRPEPTVPQPQVDTSIDNRLIGRWRDEKGEGAYVFNSDGTGEFAAVSALNEGEQQIVNINVLFTIPHWTAENGQLNFNRVWCKKEDDEATNELNTKMDPGVTLNYTVGADGNSFTTDNDGYSMTYDKTDF